jgi:transposase
MSKPKQPTTPDEMNLPLINPNAAGIDLGADRHWVSVPVGRDSESVRSERLFYSRAICNG